MFLDKYLENEVCGTMWVWKWLYLLQSYWNELTILKGWRTQVPQDKFLKSSLKSYPTTKDAFHT